MSKKFDLVVVIPVYNEEEIIAKVVEEWNNVLSSLKITYQIRVYNDGSRDESLSRLENLQKSLPQVFVVDKPNSGHGSTILRGYQEASQMAEWVFQVDGDHEMKADFFNDFWKNRQDFDLLIGIRQGRIQSLGRKIMSIASRWIVGLCYGRCVKDVNCPYRLMRSSYWQSFYKAIPLETFAPNLVISGIACQTKARVFQQIVPFKDRTTGVASIQASRFIKISWLTFYQTWSLRKLYKNLS